MSDQVVTITEALAKAREGFPTITPNKTNPHFKNRYADLASILGKVEPVLRANNLFLRQYIRDGVLWTELSQLPPTGDTLDTGVTLPVTDDPQKLGSAITYIRRYGIVTLLGLVTEEDDDAGAASNTGTHEPRTRKADKPKKADAPAEPTPATGTDGNVVALPAGWFSEEDCVQAHNALAERIARLPEEGIDQCRTYREKPENGWPMAAPALKLLEAQVSRIETIALADVATAAAGFPGATEET